MKRSMKPVLLIIVIAIISIIAGCSFKSSQDTKPSAQPSVGIIDMQTVINNHPKNAVLQQTMKEYNTLAAEVEAIQGQALSAEDAQMPSSIDSAANLNESAAKEFDARMAAKETELKTQLEAAANQVHQQLSVDMDSYVQELDKDYQPQIFSIQLKQKTLQLSKEEMAANQAEIDRIQKERAGKIAVKQQELSQKMDQIMAGKQADAKKQIDAYGQELNTSIGGKLASQQAQMVNRQTIPAPAPNAARSDKEQQLALKKQEITVLQDTIIGDIRDKAAKVAAEKGLEIVFVNVQSNISAVDITAAVIDEIKK